MVGRRIEGVVIRQPQLRWPVPSDFNAQLRGLKCVSLGRRGKYLLFNLAAKSFLIHLGMSGCLRILDKGIAAQKHDHIDFLLDNNRLVRYTDPRRFGSVHLVDGDPLQHPLLISLGPEPLSGEFSGDVLWQRSRGRKISVKQLIMDSHVVVGVGNIYANEALYSAEIRPTKLAGKVSKVAYQRLAEAIKLVLAQAIDLGGTTLKDFVNGEGKPGYFRNELKAYGRGGAPCERCSTSLKEIRQQQRVSVFCPSCQR